MNIKTDLKLLDNNNYKLGINGVNVGEFTKSEISDLVKQMDFIAHHKHELYQKYKDYFQIEIRGIDFGVWEVSQIREFISEIDV
jgi:hypothetical protein